MNPNERIVLDFIAAWSRLDVDELVSYFAEDGVYHNMPTKPVQGREKLRAFIGGFIAPWTRTQWDVIAVASSGDRVFVERLDHTQAGARAVDLPCCGVFEMENGKIKVWRDYFDMGTYARAMAG